MKRLAKVALVLIGAALALSGCGIDQPPSESAAYPLPETGPSAEFEDWFKFNPDEVGHWPVDAKGVPLEVGGALPFRIAESSYLLGTVKRVPAGTPLIFALNDRIVVQLYGSSTPECQPRIKSAVWASSQQLVVIQDDLPLRNLECTMDLVPKAFDLFPTQYPDNEFWRDPNQVAHFLAGIRESDNVLEWTSKMDYSETPLGIAYEFGGFTVADSISHRNSAATEDYDGNIGDLTYTESQDVHAVSDDGGHIICRYGQPCVSVDEFGNETVLEIDQGICNEVGCETLPATE